MGRHPINDGEMDEPFVVMVENGAVILWVPLDDDLEEWQGIAMTYRVAMKLADHLMRFAADAAPSEAEFREAAEDACIQGASYRPKRKDFVQ